ncbi:MAG: hypothetical protein KZQ65_11670, partial [Candidatus Thiodiazotropha sp. (ex Gloverina cf. vestifex)]|nr:hypothetical protein [Candidatus Thiodiazotropha sp. (ex Gloverina cf. vestifex)]
TVTITAIQPRLRLSGTNRLGFQPSMAISDRSRVFFIAFTLHDRGQRNSAKQGIVNRITLISPKQHRTITTDSRADAAKGEPPHDPTERAIGGVDLGHQLTSRRTQSR